MKETCRFCKLHQDYKYGILYEDQFFYSIFDTSPVTPGHAQIIPKRHVDFFINLNEKE